VNPESGVMESITGDCATVAFTDTSLESSESNQVFVLLIFTKYVVPVVITFPEASLVIENDFAVPESERLEIVSQSLPYEPSLLRIVYLYVSELPPLSTGGVKRTVKRDDPAERDTVVTTSGFLRGIAV
jgi:hypothetical protein